MASRIEEYQNKVFYFKKEILGIMCLIQQNIRCLICTNNYKKTNN